GAMVAAVAGFQERIGGNINLTCVSPSSSGSKRPSQTSMELANQRNEAASGPETIKIVKREGNRKVPTSISEHEGPKTPDPKVEFARSFAIQFVCLLKKRNISCLGTKRDVCLFL
ncbi:bZIP transcription factor TGA10, partial [Thalictrum thalictroides]